MWLGRSLIGPLLLINWLTAVWNSFVMSQRSRQWSWTSIMPGMARLWDHCMDYLSLLKVLFEVEVADLRSISCERNRNFDGVHWLARPYRDERFRIHWNPSQARRCILW